jgi:predicted nucleotidyltransferase
MGTIAAPSATRPVSTALFGKTRNAVLALLFGHPDESFYVREIVRAVNSGLGSVQRELTSLEEAGIVQRTTRGNQVFYQANPRSPVFDELKSLVLKTAGVAEVLILAISPLRKSIRTAFIYGSMARATQGRGSDVDVFVVGDASFDEVADALAAAQKKLAREINPTVYPIPEFREKIREKHHFVTSVLAGEKIFLIGDERELAELAGAGLGSGT